MTCYLLYDRYGPFAEVALIYATNRRDLKQSLSAWNKVNNSENFGGCILKITDK
jgi:hypothetical protein